jgi:hypothetical protein
MCSYTRRKRQQGGGGARGSAHRGVGRDGGGGRSSSDRAAPRVELLHKWGEGGEGWRPYRRRSGGTTEPSGGGGLGQRWRSALGPVSVHVASDR